MNYIVRSLYVFYLIISNTLSTITNILFGQLHKVLWKTSELTNKDDIMGPVIGRKWLKS